MPRYVAFLRGVSPMNAKNADLQRCFEAAGFTDVRTVLSSGNVVFTTPRASSNAALARRAEKAMQDGLDQAFATIVRPVKALQEMLDVDPYAGVKLPSGAKKVITFLREPPASPPRLPIEADGARILAVSGADVFTYYVPGPKGGAFMGVLERVFGKEITTRTVDTVRKCAAA